MMSTELRIKERQQRELTFSWLRHTSYCILHTSAPRGFTIIETLVAIVILLLAITGPLTLAERSLASAEVARHEITAFFLTQEAVEYIRNKRDENALTGNGGGRDWLNGLEDCTEAVGCGIDSTANSGRQIFECEEDEECLLWQHRGNPPRENMKGIFGYPRNRNENTDDWQMTLFTRKVYLRELENDKEAEVRVVVSWIQGGLGSRNVEIKTNLLNWYVRSN